MRCIINERTTEAGEEKEKEEEEEKEEDKSLRSPLPLVTLR